MERPTVATDFAKWLNGLPAVEEDHVFTPIGAQSERMTALLNERAQLLERPADDEEPAGERSLAETYTDHRDRLDREIAEQLEVDHPDAVRIRLRGISDLDIEEIADELVALGIDERKKVIEQSLRMIARAAVAPELSVDEVRMLRRRLNQGEWARLLDHVVRLMRQEAEAVDLPNS